MSVQMLMFISSTALFCYISPKKSETEPCPAFDERDAVVYK